MKVIADNQLKLIEINRSMIYWIPLLLFWLIWILLLGNQSIVLVFQDYWQSSITMIAGSFVAGATPLGGGAVAFPVFTKLMQVSSSDASFFSLLIQSVGMTFASLFFISRNTMINWKVIRYACIGSFVSLPLSLIFISLENITARFIFSEFIVFCAFIILWKKQNPYLEKMKSLYWAVLFGFLGGLLTAKIGSGCDAILYFYLVFICQHCAKDSIPTTVCFMAINSVYASIWLLLTSTPNEFVVGSWWASAPIVSIGAPLGAYVLSKLKTSQTVIMIITIISIEVISSLLLAPFSLMNKLTIVLTIMTLLMYTVWQKKYL
ncbi:sulfite exporter TauE/SafE family protein [Moritella viscosa]|uniref:Probable membrane transporter protein n=1 Tax=Moritella viscosa TaxID=80854 RepID=A0A1K9ZEL7_9GAMM|nr:sulfite exporter TauE/SafE family protein [Moritella viscosa]SGY95950.1 Predicted Permease [Moritella viscosa]SGZ08199.1 Predicted Permease [Moritella viscosa]SGZ08276.1 Predicted Permease [Moritella viscosa]SHO10321.1 Predicted Permease [Moritella viscosa]SHO10339.1 Predicted Permease [Moritella viscosa]